MTMTKREGYLHSEEDCGAHDIDVVGECCGCGKDALDVIEDERREAIEHAVKVERARIKHFINCNAGEVNVRARDLPSPAREQGEFAASVLYALSEGL